MSRDAEHADSKPAGDRPRWHRRPTVQALRRQALHETRELHNSWDSRANDDTRLPASESIALGGLVLTEAFTPSTISSLYSTLERWPDDDRRKQELLDHLGESRSGDSGGWHNLGVVRGPGAFVLGGGHHDAELPDGIDGVWLHVSYITASVVMVVATFTLKPEDGNLSALLRGDYNTRHFDLRLRVYGRFGRLRARLPWARPARYGLGYSVSDAEDEKREACLRLMREHEDTCRRWFGTKFAGRFSLAGPDAYPVIRILFTEESVPYVERHPWSRPIGLDFALPLWQSKDVDGWWLSDGQWPRTTRQRVLTMAARRADVAREPTQGESGESNWYLTQRFGTEQAPLAARNALLALLALYADRLASLRDQAGVRGFPRRAVRNARQLDHYLVGDGLDVATITSDIEMLTRDLDRFRWNVPEYEEDVTRLPSTPQHHNPVQYVPALRDLVRERAARLASDTTMTTGNIRASAELRQAIANTRLQRLIVLLSVAAVVIAIVSLVAVKH